MGIFIHQELRGGKLCYTTRPIALVGLLVFIFLIMGLQLFYRKDLGNASWSFSIFLLAAVFFYYSEYSVVNRAIREGNVKMERIGGGRVRYTILPEKILPEKKKKN